MLCFQRWFFSFPTFTLLIFLSPFIGLSCSPHSVTSPLLMVNVSALSLLQCCFLWKILKGGPQVVFASVFQPHCTDDSNIMCLVNYVQGHQYSTFMHQLLSCLKKKWNFATVMLLYFILVLILQFFTWFKSFLHKSNTQLNWQFMFARRVYQQSTYWA